MNTHMNSPSSSSSSNQLYRQLVQADPTLCTEIIQFWKSTYCPYKGDEECWTSNLKPNKAGGYVQGSYNGNNKFAQMHVVAFWSKGDQSGTSDGDVSHLCNNPVCFNPHHVCYEQSIVNQSRKGCVGIVIVNNVKYRVCQHEPMCLKQVTLTDDNIIH